MPSNLIRVSEEAINLERVNHALSDAQCGAELVFVGVVRDKNEGRRVTAVTYEAFVPLAKKTLLALANEVREKVGPPLRVALLHRLGTLQVGEISTVIGVSSPHRSESYDASRYLIEQIKLRLPVWKEEHYIDGSRDWLDGVELAPKGGSGDTSGRTIIAHGRE
ncbi:MAG: hypothetical protein DCC75_12945 [Proteobacteria bacterium]|nr:MAG: hypothetical protein DCC75_12945 [Pseudomonadota bacterium]